MGIQNERINVVLLGEKDHGKSTIIGRLLFDSDNITEGKVGEIQRMAEEYKRKFEFAYFLDAFSDEIEEERTIDTTEVLFKGKNRTYAIIDVPGHKEFLKAMLTGASRADVAILVVGITDGVVEQTKRHLFLCGMIGIKHLIVAVNKMDIINYEQDDEYKTILNILKKVVISAGYYKVPFIPISAMEGDNIYKKSEKMPWYSGESIVDYLDKIAIKQKEKPTRFIVQGTMDGVTLGRVETGNVFQGSEMIFLPSSEVGIVRKVVGNEPKNYGSTGSSVGLVLTCTPCRGDVGFLPEHEGVHKPITSMCIQIFVLEDCIERGEELVITCGTKKAKCRVIKIAERVDISGALIKNGWEVVPCNEAANLVLKTEPMVAERFEDIPELGRITLENSKGRKVAAGIIQEVGI